MVTTRFPSVLVPRFLLDGHRAELDVAVTDRARILDADELSASDDLPDGLEVVITGMEKALLERAISTPSVRWVHSISAGVEHLPLDRMAERGVLLTNAAGAYASAMAEYALGTMILLARRLTSWLDGQRERRWIEGGTFDAMVLRGKRLGIVGYGAVGRELATAARALGMEVWATKRSPLFLSGEPLDRLLAVSDLLELLAESDVIVLCASLNRSTRHLIGERELRVMKPTAMLVNVARGGLVDEDALVRALAGGRLRGAMLDVTIEEPLPAESPLWSAPNLLITPHISGNAPESWGWGVEFLCANLRLYLDGTPERMGNLVEYDAVR